MNRAGDWFSPVANIADLISVSPQEPRLEVLDDDCVKSVAVSTRIVQAGFFIANSALTPTF